MIIFLGPEKKTPKRGNISAPTKLEKSAELYSRSTEQMAEAVKEMASAICQLAAALSEMASAFSSKTKNSD